MMELDLDRQPHGRSELEIAGSLPLEAGEGYPATATVAGTLAVQNLESRFLLNGTLAATGASECGRCLRKFTLQWPAPVAMMVLRDVDSEEEEGETLLVMQRQGIVDLRDPLRECVILAYPQSPVCSEDCKGLCASCGADLNLETCACENEEHDPRWDGLPD